MTHVWQKAKVFGLAKEGLYSVWKNSTSTIPARNAENERKCPGPALKSNDSIKCNFLSQIFQ